MRAKIIGMMLCLSGFALSVIPILLRQSSAYTEVYAVMIENQFTNRHATSVSQNATKEGRQIEEDLDQEITRIHDRTLRGTLETYARKTHTFTALLTLLGAFQSIIGAIILARCGKEKSSNNRGQCKFDPRRANR